MRVGGDDLRRAPEFALPSDEEIVCVLAREGLNQAGIGPIPEGETLGMDRASDRLTVTHSRWNDE